MSPFTDGVAVATWTGPRGTLVSLEPVPLFELLRDDWTPVGFELTGFQVVAPL